MAVVPFVHYMHDNQQGNEFVEDLQTQGIDIEYDGELYHMIGRPFYEIKLNCTLDTETGKVEILETIL